MSPIELIREGLIKKNWDLVYDGFQQMTGETLTHISRLHGVGTKRKSILVDDIRKEEEKKEEEEDLLNPIVEPTKQVGRYGNATVLITDGNPSNNYETNEAERKFNEKRAETRGPRKLRKNSETEMVCNECDKKFKTKYGKTDRKCKECLMKHCKG